MESIYNIINLLTIPIQCVGALICINSFSTKKEAIVKRFCNSNSIIIENTNTNEIQYKEDAYKKEWEQAYQGIWGFSLISVGFLLAMLPVANEAEYPWWYRILITGILYIIIYRIINYKVNKSSKEKITKEDLDKLGIKPDIGNISNSEIEKICK